MFFIFLMTAAGAMAHGLTWDHDGSLIKFNQYTYNHQYEIYDAFRHNKKIFYRNKEITLENTIYFNSDTENKF